MIKDLEGCSEYKVSEIGADFAQLVDAMYAPGMKEQPLNENTICNLSGE